MQPMRRESPYPMVEIAEAKRLIAAYNRVLGQETIAGLFADGRVLAEDIYAAEPMPDMPKAAVDGYALRAEDGLAPRQVLAELTAGSAQHLAVEPGTAVRIMTGAPVPPGANAVIMVEQTTEQNGVLQIERTLKPGDFIHPIGQDLVRGTLVLPRGTVLGSAEIGLLAMLGRTQVAVYRRPVVAVLATGDEVFEPDALPAEGGIRDSNRYALLAAVRAAGCETISLGIARDDRETQRAAMLGGLERADMLLTSGGVSMGTRDLIKPLLAELGSVHFGRVSFKPGKPTTFATVGSKIAFGLPGYPVSSLVSFEVFVRPMLRAMQGDTNPERPHASVLLGEPIQASPDRTEYQRATVRYEAGQLVVRTTGAQTSSRLLSLRDANALLIVPPRPEAYPQGSSLQAMLTGTVR